jgi:hypothetical protein
MRALLDIGDGVGKPLREVDDALPKVLFVDTDFAGELRPLIPADLVKAVLAADLHCELQLPFARRSVGEDTRDVVERREPHAPAGREEGGVVLRVGVGAADEPVEGDGIDEARDVFRRRARFVAQQLDDVPYAGAAIVFVFPRGMNAERLTEILLS